MCLIGVYVYSYVHSGKMPMDLCAGQWDVMKMLLNKGLPVDAVMSKTDFVCYPLMYIFIQHNEMELVHCLVDHGHSVNMPICFTADRRSHSVTPLVLALTCRSDCALSHTSALSRL